MTQTANPQEWKWDCNCPQDGDHGCCYTRHGTWHVDNGGPTSAYCVLDFASGHCPWCGARLNADGTITAMAPAGSPSVEWVLGEIARLQRDAHEERAEVKAFGPAERERVQYLQGWRYGLGHLRVAISEFAAEHPAPAPEAPTTAVKLLTGMISEEVAGRDKAAHLPEHVCWHAGRKAALMRARDRLLAEHSAPAGSPSALSVVTRFRNWCAKDNDRADRGFDTACRDHKPADAAYWKGYKGAIETCRITAEAELRRSAPAPQWSAEWPTEPGDYWVAMRIVGGWTKPRIVPAMMHSDGEVHPFMAHSEDEEYIFLPATVPDPPQPAPAAREDGDRGGQRC